MIPYGSFAWFAFLLYPVVPTVILGALARLPRGWVLFWTLFVVAFQYGAFTVGAPLPLLEILAFAVWQYTVAAVLLVVRRKSRSRWPVWIAVLCAALPLLGAKTAGVLLLGLSYLTFRAIDVLLAVQDRLVKTLPVGDYLAFLLFFPTLLAGPIDRYRRFREDLHRARTGPEFRADVEVAVSHFFTGLLYKFILATLIERHWLEAASASAGVAATVSYMYAFTLYIFFDFAGYSAFAIAISHLLGVRTPENFDAPYLAPNIREFWNRWHMSLSFWLRDHVYMRFLMSATRGKWFRSRELASHVGMLLSFTLMGLWHGLTLRYLTYGVFHGVAMIVYDAFHRRNTVRRDGFLWRAAGVVLTFHVFAFSMLLFTGRLEEGVRLQRPATPMYEGRQDPANCDTISGWAWDPSRPDEALEVDISSVHGTMTVKADRYRSDLRGMGNARHGFSVPMPAELKNGQPVRIYVRVHGTKELLTASPQLYLCGESDLRGLQGVLDYSNGQVLTGWAYDPRRGPNPLRVDFYEGGTLLGSVTADRTRSGLNDYFQPIGAHGFSWPLPPELRDGRTHRIHAVAEGGFELPNSPQEVRVP